MTKLNIIQWIDNWFATKEDLNNYYTKDEIDQMLNDLLNDTLYNVYLKDRKLYGNYYEESDLPNGDD